MLNDFRKGFGEPETGEDGRYCASFEFTEDFCGFKGHFPGNAVLPGVCQLFAFSVLAEKAAGAKLKLKEVSRAKFLSVVLPGETVEFRFTLSAQDGLETLTGETSVADRGTVGKFKMIFGADNA